MRLLLILGLLFAAIAPLPTDALGEPATAMQPCHSMATAMDGHGGGAENRDHGDRRPSIHICPGCGLAAQGAAALLGEERGVEIRALFAPVPLASLAAGPAPPPPRPG